MCRHCERLVADVQHKQLMHDFMKVTAEGVNRKLREDNFDLFKPITADDLDLKIEVNALQTRPNGLALHPAVLKLIYRDLPESME